MQEFQFAYMAHGKHNAAQYRHDLLVCEGTPRLHPALDFLLNRVLLVLEVLYYFVLLRADVGLRQDLVVVGVEIELVLEGHTASVFPDILVHELLTGESMLDCCYQFS